MSEEAAPSVEEKREDGEANAEGPCPGRWALLNNCIVRLHGLIPHSRVPPAAAQPQPVLEKPSAQPSEQADGQTRRLARIVKPKLQWDTPQNPATEAPGEVS